MAAVHNSKGSANLSHIDHPKGEAYVNKIKWDRKLNVKPSIFDVENRIEAKVKYYGELQEKLNCNIPVFPSDYELVQLTRVVYKDRFIKQPKLPNGWTLLTLASNAERTNGYYGCAYFNEAHQQIVIAHRVTNSLKAVWNDLNGVVFSEFVSQINSAITFTKSILNLINKFNETGAYLKLSFTGHLLGGLLAQVTTFTAKYLTIDELRDEVCFSLIQETQTGYHAHTVVFESPGCKVMLEQLKTAYTEFYGDEIVIDISIDSLDITTYLSAPNRINCCNAHVGQIYRIFVDFSDVNWLEKEIWHLIDTHKIKKIIACFDSETGLVRRNSQGHLQVQEVLNWPMTEGIVFTQMEYDTFLQFASKFNEYHGNIDAHCFGDQRLRYHTQNVNEKSFKLNVFNEIDNNFVQGYNICHLHPKHKSVVFSGDTDNDKLVFDSAIEKLDSMKFQIDSETKRPSLDPDVRPLDFVSYIKRLNHFFPNLIRVNTKDSIFDPITGISIYQEIYLSMKSFEYLSPIRENSLDLDVDSINLIPFLINENSQVLLNVEDKTSFGALKIYKIFESIKSRTNFDGRNSLFINMKRILHLKQLNFASVLKIKEDYLIVIENDDKSVAALKSLKEIFVYLKRNQRIKVILIVDREFEVDWTEIIGEYKQSLNEGIQLFDLSSDSRNEILKRELINFQGNRVSFAQLFPGVEKSRCAKDLIKIARDNGRELDVRNDYITNSRFDVFTVNNITLDKFQKLIPNGERITLYKDWNPTEMVRFVILDKDQAEAQFENICCHLSQKFRIHWLVMAGNQLILKDSKSHSDGDNDEFIEKLFTEKLERPVCEVLNGCFAIGTGFKSISSIGKCWLKSVINSDVLIKLGSNVGMKAGSELPKLGKIKDYYVGRTLSKQAKLIDSSTLVDSKHDIYAICNTQVNEFQSDTKGLDRDLITHYNNWVLKKKSGKIRFIILDVDDAKHQFSQIYEFYTKRNIHFLNRVGKQPDACLESLDRSPAFLFQYGNDDNNVSDDHDYVDEDVWSKNVVWYTYEQSRMCSNEADVLRLVNGQVAYKENSQIGETDQVSSTNDIRDSVVTVVGLPGMGKSTLFTHLALQKKKSFPFLWVINLKFDAIPWDSLVELQNTSHKVQMMEFFAQILNLEPGFERSLFEYCLSDEKVVLIFDAFDEVSLKYNDQILGLLNTLQTEMKVKQLWLSSRPYALKDERLNKGVYTLQGIKREDQSKFLLKFWKKQLDLDIDLVRSGEFSKKLLKLLPCDINGDDSKSISGIPLILKILAEQYRDEFELFYLHNREFRQKEFAIHTFYDFVIDIIINQVYDEKLATNTKKVKAKKQRKTIAAVHKLLAMVACKLDSLVTEQSSPISELIEGINNGEEMTGLISGVVNGVPQFIHPTIAEYFASKWLIEQMVAITEDNERFIHLFKGLSRLFRRRSEVVYSLFNSQLSDNKDLNEKLKKHLKENKDLVKYLVVMSDCTYLNINRFKVQMGADYKLIYHGKPCPLNEAIKEGNKYEFERACQHVYGVECDYKSLILHRQLMHLVGLSGAKSEMASFLLSKVKPEDLPDVVNDKSCGVTALHMAVPHCHVDLAKVLIQNGADVGVRGKDGLTALDMAFKIDSEEMVQLLLNTWVINSPLDLFKTCELIEGGKVKMIMLIYIWKCFERRSQFTSTMDDCCRSRLGYALGTPNCSFVNSLISLTSEVSSEVSEIRYDLARLLKSECPIVEVQDVMNAPACHPGNEQLFVALIGNIALKYPNHLSRLFSLKNREGEMLLHMAARLGYVATAQLMIGLGAHVNTRNDKGETAMMIAANCGHFGFVLWLLSREDDVIEKAVNMIDLKAVSNSDLLVEIVDKHLSDTNQLLTKRFNGGDTLLHIASQSNNVKLAKIIIDRGADVNARSDDKHTPLSLACKNGHVEMVQLLIAKGASVNDKQQSPLLWAVYGHSKFIVEFLIRMGADVKAKCSFPNAINKCLNVWTPLQLLVDRYAENWKDYNDIVNLLLVFGADVTTCFNNMPFDQIKDYANLIVTFVMSGADIYAKNHEGVSLVSFMEEHWQVAIQDGQNVLKAIVLFSKCKPPEKLLKEIHGSAVINQFQALIIYAMRFKKRIKEKIPEFYKLINAVKSRDVRKIQQHFHGLLIGELQLNRAFNSIDDIISSEIPYTVSRRCFLTSTLQVCVAYLMISMFLLTKDDISDKSNLTLYNVLKSLSGLYDGHCNKYQAWFSNVKK